MDNNNNFVDANSTQSNENSNNTRLNSTFQAKHPNNFTKTKTILYLNLIHLVQILLLVS